MELITRNDELIVGREYWLRNKISTKIFTGKCGLYDGWKFIIVRQGDTYGERIWSEDRNSQALAMFDIIGPIPENEVPDFDKYVIKNVG